MRMPGLAATFDGVAGMKRLALLLLVSLFGTYLVAIWWVEQFPWLAWVRAFAEAGSVGAVADWFAVTALFRRPLGLPIPHTAIIPAKRDQIGESLGRFVESNLLTPENLLRRFGELEVVRAAAQWLCEGSNRFVVARAIADLVPAVLHQVRSGDLQPTIERLLTRRLQRIDAARCAGDLLELVVRERLHQAVLDKGLALLAGWLEEHRQLIGEKFGEASWITSRYFDHYVSNRFVDGIQAVLREIADDPEHDVRRRFDLALRLWIADLGVSGETARRAQRLLRLLVRRLQASDALADEWRRMARDVADDCSRSDSRSVSLLASLTAEFGRLVANDAALRGRMEQSLRRTLGRLLERNRREVGRIISRVVGSWDTRHVVDKVEANIGRDLQYIRISGSLVGGCAGVLIHLVTVLAVP